MSESRVPGERSGLAADKPASHVVNAGGIVSEHWPRAAEDEITRETILTRDGVDSVRTEPPAMVVLDVAHSSVVAE